jgi:hypothetical protein
MNSQPPARIGGPYRNFLLLAGWILLAGLFAIYSWKLIAIGLDIRRQWPAYWQPAKPAEALSVVNSMDSPPPLYTLMLKWWAAHVDSKSPAFGLNVALEGLTALAMFALVWIWVERGKKFNQSLDSRATWRARWGDPFLLSPAILLGVLLAIHPLFKWTAAFPVVPPHLMLDHDFTDLEFWFFLVLRFLAAVGLVRFLPSPFRGPACGLVAATLVWINPAMLLAGCGWPQADPALLACAILTAVLISLDWWLAAGFALAAGIMTSWQFIFFAPVLALPPLFAGWGGRFLRLLGGAGAGIGLIAWPWIIRDRAAQFSVAGTFAAAAIVCAAALCRTAIWRQIKANRVRPFQWAVASVTILAAFALLFWSGGKFAGPLRAWTISMAIAVLAVPWFLQRRLLPAWLVLVFATSLWITAFRMGASFAWWKTDLSSFAAAPSGKTSFNLMANLIQFQLGALLHNPLSDVTRGLVGVYFAAAALCVIGAAVHLRRRDPRYVLAVAAPFVLFLALLTQSSPRFAFVPAIMAASMVAVSVGMSLWQLLLALVACALMAQPLIDRFPSAAPLTAHILAPQRIGLSWIMLIVAAVFLWNAIAPGRRTSSD